MDRAAVGPVQPPSARQQGSGPVRGRARLTQRGTADRARLAVPARRDEHEHHMVTRLEVRPAGPLDRSDLLDDARRLMPQSHRHRPRAGCR